MMLDVVIVGRWKADVKGNKGFLMEVDVSGLWYPIEDKGVVVT